MFRYLSWYLSCPDANARDQQQSGTPYVSEEGLLEPVTAPTWHLLRAPKASGINGTSRWGPLAIDGSNAVRRGLRKLARSFVGRVSGSGRARYGSRRYRDGPEARARQSCSDHGSDRHLRLWLTSARCRWPSHGASRVLSSGHSGRHLFAVCQGESRTWPPRWAARCRCGGDAGYAQRSSSLPGSMTVMADPGRALSEWPGRRGPANPFRGRPTSPGG